MLLFFYRHTLHSPSLFKLWIQHLYLIYASCGSLNIPGTGLIAFINLHNSEMFDWTVAFPPSKEYFIPFCNSNTSNKSFNGISLQTRRLCMVIAIPHRAHSQPKRHSACVQGETAWNVSEGVEERSECVLTNSSHPLDCAAALGLIRKERRGGLIVPYRSTRLWLIRVPNQWAVIVTPRIQRKMSFFHYHHLPPTSPWWPVLVFDPVKRRPSYSWNLT